MECHFDHEMVIARALPKLIPDFTPSCIVISTGVRRLVWDGDLPDATLLG
jgi:hypothetical protein